MAALLDQARYNELPSLDKANARFREPHIRDVVNGPLRDLFLKHGVHNTLCLYLQHRHHTVDAHEAIVKVDGTTHVMNDQNIKDIDSFGNQVLPATWMTTENGMQPMEFAVVSKNTAMPELSADFINDFLCILAENKCEKLFGIDTIAKADWSEMSIGGSSVVVPSNGDHTYDAVKYIPVALSFDEKDSGFKVHGKCKRDHRHTSAA